MLRDQIKTALLDIDDCYAAIEDEELPEEDKELLFELFRESENALNSALSVLGRYE